MAIIYHKNLIQGTEEWHAQRCGLLTASEMKFIVTPTLKIANNEKTRMHLWELMAQRITNYVEPTYIGDDMLRGRDDEIEARIIYNDKIAAVSDCGFVTNDEWGFTIGYSPDGLVGDEGQLECKSRRQKYQIQTIVENIGEDRGESIPQDFVMQCQTGLLVTKRKWLDFISYSGGLGMAIIRVYPNSKVQNAIIEAAGEFESEMARKMETYKSASANLIQTERKEIQEMYV